MTSPGDSRSALGSSATAAASGNIYIGTGVDAVASVPTLVPFLSSSSSSSLTTTSPNRSNYYEEFESHLQQRRHRPQLTPTSTNEPMSNIQSRSSISIRALDQQRGRPHIIGDSELVNPASGDRCSGSMDNGLAEDARSSFDAAVPLMHVDRLPALRPSSTIELKKLPRLAPMMHFAADDPNLLSLSKDLSPSLMIGNEVSSSNAALTTATTIPPFRTLSARGTPKGPLPMDVQISLLTSVLKHDPFNCPIRRTTQVWERIAKEQGIRARTCARRYDNIIQASIAERDQPAGTEEQIATKKRLLEQVFTMMNQPQAVVRMQKKRRYRSEEADKSLLLEVIRLNPFAQKIGQVAKVWEDVRDALGMTVHARQCIRRVNRIIKQYQLRGRMYNGNIPEEMQEANDELVKEAIQLMNLGGHGGSLEDDEGQSNGEDSASDASDFEGQEDAYTSFRVRKRNAPQDDEELGEDEDEDMADLADAEPATARYQKLDGNPTMDSAVRLAKQSQSRNPLYGSTDKRKTLEINAVKDKSVRAAEAEFRPQRIWGSHPYSQEATTRSSSKRRSYHAGHGESVDTGAGHQRSAEPRVGSPSGSLSRMELDMEQIRSPSSSNSSSFYGPGYHQPPAENQNPRFIELDSQVYRTILNEFKEVKGYLDRLNGQRQRDKDNQKKMYQIIEGLQHQMQEQQRSIRDLQHQMGDRQRWSYPRSSASPSQHTDHSQVRRHSGEHHLSLAVDGDEEPDDREQTPQ
ncbi:hypothetical protein BGZ58_007367 [Dissophora ornata]|nr:hypothetical protein BGZ58_007367 [Dissophora ornata]